MPFGLWVVVGWMALVALSGLALIAWGLRTHQFDDVEEPKYRMMEDREPEGWPGRPGSGGGGKHA
jgi:cbb3-type cytochrome oxidase maturation protein